MLVITTSCPNFSFQKFPFDILECSIVMNPFENVNQLEYSVSRFQLDTSVAHTFIGQTEIWSLIPDSLTFSVTNITQFGDWEVNNIEFKIRLQRKYHYYIAQIFVPQAGLFALQFSTLILPPEKAERPAFSMTVVLAYFFILDMIFSQIPKTTETVYVVIMTVVKLLTSILLTIYMLVTCTIVSSKKLKFVISIRKLDKITAIVSIIITLSVDIVLFYIMSTTLFA